MGKLWVVFALQGMANGFWLPVLTNVLEAKGHGQWVAIAFATLPVCALITPLLGGALADERFPAQKLYGVATLISAVFLALAFGALDYGLGPIWFIVGLGCFGLFGGPSWGFLANIGLSNLAEPEKHFPYIRLGATLGWVGAGLLTSHVFHTDMSPACGYVAAVAMGCAGVLGFFLPNTPPLGAGRDWKSALGIGAFRLFRNRNHAVLFCTAGLFSVPLAAFYMYSPELFRVLGNTSPTAWMTIAQGTEVVAMLFLGALMLKFRMKTLLLWGLGVSVLRYGLSGYAGLSGEVGWHVAGVALHGFCYTIFFVTAQVYVSQRVERGLRGQAQGLLSLMTSGLGNLVGAFFCGWLRGTQVDGSGLGWAHYWWILAGVIAACFVGFGVLYQGRKAGE